MLDQIYIFLLFAQVLPSPGDNSRRPVRARDRHVVCRLYRLRAVDWQDPLQREIEQRNAKVLHGSQRKVPQQNDQEGNIQGATF